MRVKVVTTAGAAITLAGTFLTWVRSGTVDRSSYDLFELVARLGFSEGGLIAWALRAWPLVPLLVVLAVIAVWAEPPALLTLGSVSVASLYPALTAIAIVLAPSIALFEVAWGPLVTLIGATVMMSVTVTATISATLRERSTRLSESADDRS